MLNVGDRVRRKGYNFTGTISKIGPRRRMYIYRVSFFGGLGDWYTEEEIELYYPEYVEIIQ